MYHVAKFDKTHHLHALNLTSYNKKIGKARSAIKDDLKLQVLYYIDTLKFLPGPIFVIETSLPTILQE